VGGGVAYPRVVHNRGAAIVAAGGRQHVPDVRYAKAESKSDNEHLRRIKKMKTKIAPSQFPAVVRQAYDGRQITKGFWCLKPSQIPTQGQSH
jgi:hypothetical protein